jgi:hypothetical protein
MSTPCKVAARVGRKYFTRSGGWQTRSVQIGPMTHFWNSCEHLGPYQACQELLVHGVAILRRR